MIIASHNGQFHADDACATMVIAFCHPKEACEIVRTRDPKIISQADVAIDVGGVSDPATLRFDHHQKGFSDARPTGVVYASAGLVWKEFGSRFVKECAYRIGSSLDVDDSMASMIADQLDDEYIQYLDMADTGASIAAPGFFGASSEVSLFNVTLLDEHALRERYPDKADYARELSALTYRRFGDAMDRLKVSLTNMVRHKISIAVAASIVRSAELTEGGSIMILDVPNLEWDEVIHREFPNVLFVVYPDSTDKQYQVRTVTLRKGTFENRKALPSSWAGLRDLDLAKVTGVSDSVFCHNNVFIAGAGSRQGAIELAILAQKA